MTMAKYKRFVFILLCLSSVISGEDVIQDRNGLPGYRNDQQLEQNPLPAFSGPKDSVQAAVSPDQQSPQPPAQLSAEKRVSSLHSIFDTDSRHSLSNTGNKGVQQNLTELTKQSQSGVTVPQGSVEPASDSQADRLEDEPSVPDIPDSVEISLSDTNLKSEVKSTNISSAVNESRSHSHNTSNLIATSDPDLDSEEDDRSYGNPPLRQNSEELAENISGLSPEQREKLRAQLADKLGLSAFDPGLAMLPMGPNVQSAASKGTSSPVSTLRSSTTTESSKSPMMINGLHNFKSVSKTGSVSGTESDVDDVEVSPAVNDKENHGRKVLNEGQLEDTMSQNDADYDMNFEQYLHDYYDEDEDDYEGGEVMASDTPHPLEGDIADSEEAEGQRTDESTTTPMMFDYDEDNDGDWYYNPEEAVDLLKEANGHHSTLVPVVSKPEDANDNPSAVGGERVMSKGEDPVRKALQAPKATILLYTMLIVLIIGGFVFFTVWNKTFQIPNGRPLHQPSPIRTGEEGKRLLDHPFV